MEEENRGGTQQKGRGCRRDGRREFEVGEQAKEEWRVDEVYEYTQRAID